MTETNPNFLIVHTSWYEEHIDNMVFIASKELDFFQTRPLCVPGALELAAEAKRFLTNEEYKKIRDEVQTPKSIMRFGRKQDQLNDLCLLVSHNEKLRKTKRKALFGTSEISNYTMLPEHSRWFIKYFTKEDDLVCDNTCGRGTNLIAACYEKRRIIGYDLSADNLESIRDACVNHIGAKPEDVLKVMEAVGGLALKMRLEKDDEVGPFGFNKKPKEESDKED